MSCAKHPDYKVKRAPTSDCHACQEMWRNKVSNTPRKRSISFRTVAEYATLNEAFKLQVSNVEKFSMKQTKLFTKKDIRKFVGGDPAPVRPIKVEISFIVPQAEMEKIVRRRQKFMKSQVLEKR